MWSCEFFKSALLLRSVSAVAKLLLALYFGHGFGKFGLHSSIAQVGVTSKLLLALYFGHGFTNSKLHSSIAQVGVALKVLLALYFGHGFTKYHSIRFLLV
jgi:hypothetical protein